MTVEHYKVVPAPAQARKVRGVKSTADRFALTLTDRLNEMAAEGWEFLRAETLPCEEKKGFTGTQTTFQTLLVFRRAERGAVAEAGPEAETAPEAPQPPQPRFDDLEDHDGGDPRATALGETLRASRRPDDGAGQTRRLGPARGD